MVAVLDNTIGGFLTLGIQRIMGTIIGGVASIVIMTIVRSIFRYNWDWRPTLLLCVLMFIQIFFIAKIKLIPNYSYAGSIVRIPLELSFFLLILCFIGLVDHSDHFISWLP